MAHDYLLKIWITHNKKTISLLNLLASCISVRPALEILPIKDECTLHL